MPVPRPFPPGAALVESGDGVGAPRGRPRARASARRWPGRARQRRRSRSTCSPSGRPGCSPAGPPGSRCRSRCGTSTGARCCRPSPSRSVVPPPPRPAHLALVDTIVEPAAPCRSSSTASSPGRSAGSRCAGSSTTPHTGAVRLEVGVGAHDREAFAIIHGDMPDRRALAGVVGAVVAHRGADAPQHPLNRLAPERLLRWRLEQDPALVGLRRVDAGAAAGAAAERQGPRAVHGARPARRTDHRSSSCAPSASTSTWSRTRSTPGSPPRRRAANRASWGRSGLVAPPRDLVPVTAELAGAGGIRRCRWCRSPADRRLAGLDLDRRHRRRGDLDAAGLGGGDGADGDGQAAVDVAWPTPARGRGLRRGGRCAPTGARRCDRRWSACDRRRRRRRRHPGCRGGRR